MKRSAVFFAWIGRDEHGHLQEPPAIAQGIQARFVGRTVAVAGGVRLLASAIVHRPAQNNGCPAPK